MSLQPIPNFTSLQTHHCVTGSLQHLYHFYGHPISEDLLLGLGEGVSFIYWHQKGTTPFLGGRGNPKPSVEELAAQRTGVRLTPHTTSSARKAEKSLKELLLAGEPVMLQVDMGFLPYFDFGGTEYHFGGHAVVACGYDPETEDVLIADRDGLYPVSMTDLAQARGSKYKPFPPQNRWYTADFTGVRAPTPAEIQEALRNMTKLMLHPPIRNLGIKGIRKAAEMVPKWPELLSAEELRWTLFNAHIFISPVGGTGGGTFRYMFSRFLCEAAALLADRRLEPVARDFHQIGDAWEELGVWFHDLSAAENAAKRIEEGVQPLQALANREEAAWQALYALVRSD